MSRVVRKPLRLAQRGWVGWTLRVGFSDGTEEWQTYRVIAPEANAGPNFDPWSASLAGAREAIEDARRDAKAFRLVKEEGRR